MILNEEFEVPGYERINQYDEKRTDILKEQFKTVIHTLGEDVEREGLLKTPERVAKSWQFLTHGYNLNPHEIIKSALFEEDSTTEGMVIVKNIELYSVCEHHMIPFFGKAHIGYLPNGKITGLSKFARVVDAYSRRLQVQERLTNQIMHCIQETLDPHGVAVVIEAKHMCMMMRGVEKQNSVTTTSSFTGVFKDNATRSEFIKLINADLH